MPHRPTANKPLITVVAEPAGAWVARNPEVQAGTRIDELLTTAGWHVCDIKDLNLSAHRRLAELMIEFDLGVGRESTYIINRLDSDYFEN